MSKVAKSTRRYNPLQVAIAGAGLIGRLLGWHFTQQGASVTIHERASKRHPLSAAHVAAAMLAPMSERPHAEREIYDMGLASLDIWPTWCQQLGVNFGKTGSVVVAHGIDLPLLDKFENTLASKGVPEGDVCRIERDTLNDLEPDLATQFSRGLLLQREGWLDNRQLLAALEVVCGRIVYESSVSPQQLDADLVIDCRGSGSTDPQLRSVRGEVIRVHAPEVQLTRPVRLLHPRYRLYVSPRTEGRYVIGATEIESDSTAPVTVRSALELLSAAFAIHPGFAEATVEELRSGLRPAYPDNMPRVEWQGNVLAVNGLYRHGFLIAPAIVNEVARTVEHRWTSFSTATA